MPKPGFERRRWVPESHPDYVDERMGTREINQSQIFGLQAMRSYEQSLRHRDDLLRVNIRLRSDRREAARRNVRFDIDRINEALEININNLRLVGERITGDAASVLGTFINFLGDLQYLLRIAPESKKTLFLYQQFRDLLQTDKDRYLDFLKVETPTEVVSSFLSRVKSGEISLEMVCGLIARHVERVHQQSERLAEIVIKIKEELRSSIQFEVQHGFLPASVLDALSRLDDVEVMLMDKFNNPRRTTLGASFGVLNIISVSNEQLASESLSPLRHTLIHEFLHVLSGTSITIETITDEDDVKMRSTYQRETGVMLAHPESRQRYVWLNEAITEWLALRLSGYNEDIHESAYLGSRIYVEERCELDRLMASGLDPEIVTRAYFENFVAGTMQAQSIGRHFAALVREVDKIEGRYGFIRLENKHILMDIARRFYQCHLAYISTVKSEALYDLERLSGARLYSVQVSVGSAGRSEVKQSFYFVVTPFDDDAATIERRWQEVEQVIASLKRIYKREVKFSVSQISRQSSVE